MIYVVSRQQELFNDENFKCINVEESLALLKTFNRIIQVDTETDGKDAHINKLLCTQLGNKDKSTQIVVDNSTIDIRVYKEELEQSLLIFQNGKFDLQFFFNYGIVPLNIWDTMIIEQLLHLGFPSGLSISKEEYEEGHYDFPYHIKDDSYQLSYALDAICYKRLGIKLDKSIRGKIRYLGLDHDVITYAAHDVVYLYDVMGSQKKDLQAQGIFPLGAQIENYFVPVIAYLEWCGIKIDVDKWKAKMVEDLHNRDSALKKLNAWFISQKTKYPEFKKYCFIDRQGDLFTGFNTDEQVSINWDSPDQVVKIVKILGFDTRTKDKKSGEEKDSVLAKVLKKQKGINDDFLKLYFAYTDASTLVDGFGQKYLNSINPKTGRLHTVFRQLGTTSGRMACGSTQVNEDLTNFNKDYLHSLPKIKGKYQTATYPQLQNLPADERTRSCFVAEKGNLFCSCDFGA